jgi:phosphoribosylformylglycinamidine cyclo-ligase
MPRSKKAKEDVRRGRFNTDMHRAGLSDDPYVAAGVDAPLAEEAVARLVPNLSAAAVASDTKTLIGPGHYAAIIGEDWASATAICTDGVGTKAMIASALERYDTIGIDCVAMNVNDIICVGAKPAALVDYIAIEKAEPDVIDELTKGLGVGAQEAGIVVPGGEIAQLAEMLAEHTSGIAFDIVGTCVGTVNDTTVILGDDISPGDVIIGIGSNGVHANGLTLVRRILERHGISFRDHVPGIDNPFGDELLRPTAIYVRAIRSLLQGPVSVTGLAHITSTGLLNLLRLNSSVGYVIDRPLDPSPVFESIGTLGEQAGFNVAPEHMYTIFNMGIGFCCIVRPSDVDETIGVLREHHSVVDVIGHVDQTAGTVAVPPLSIAGTRDGGFSRLD